MAFSFGTRKNDDGGFTLIEVVVAMAVLAMVMVSISVGMFSALNLARNNRNRSIGANLASREMDNVRSQAARNFLSLPLSRVTSVQSVDGTNYTVIRDSEYVFQGATGGPCDGVPITGPTSRLAFLRVSVSVAWPDMRGVAPVKTQTVITPPVGAFDPYKGNIAVKVRDRTGAVSAGRTVNVPGATPSPSQVTTADGCAFFPALTPTAWTALVSTPNFVDPNGRVTPSTPVTVSVGQTSNTEFTYDLAATLNVSLTGTITSVVPSAISVTIANPGLQLGAKSINGSGNNRTLTNLFPFPSGYEVWAGNCTDADPEGQKPAPGGAYYPGASRASPVAVPPGGTSSTALTLPTVDVKVTASGVPSSGATVRAIHAADSAPNSCTLGEVLVVGTTDSAGLIRVALPYGTWRFQASKGGLSSGSLLPSPPDFTVGKPAAGVILSPTIATVPFVTLTMP